MNTETTYEQILHQKKWIERIFQQLKSEFIGLDRVIGELEILITPALLFPDAQLRPSVINLWGLTGSGKTALIQRLVELLEYKDKYMQFDMGEFESDSANWLKYTLTGDLDHFDQKQVIIAFDEFQFARTLDADNKELGKDKLRVIWELLDSGKISYTPNNNSYYLKRANACLTLLLRCVEKGVEIVNGKVVSQAEVFCQTFQGFYFENVTRYNTEMSADYFISKDFIEGLNYLYDEDGDLNVENIELQLKGCDLDEILLWLVNGIRKKTALRELDLSKAIIFVIGNLDEAYYMSHSLNPDISADELFEATSKINISNIKRALKKRFRNEQIARLGNNHIIYTSFRNQDFRALIQRELAKINNYMLAKFSLHMSFDDSIVDIVYEEGVFPTQGTRPVFTTVKNLIEGRLGNLVLKVIQSPAAVKKADWSFKDDCFHFELKQEDDQVVEQYNEKVVLKTNPLRQSDNSDVQAHTAVHEAGHAIVAALTLRIIPAVVVSKTASDNSDGFCLINFPEKLTTRELIRKDIAITLAGFVAEKMIFGEEHTSDGVYSDIESASRLASSAIRQYAMGSSPFRLSVASACKNDELLAQPAHEQEAMDLIHACMKEAEELLDRNRLVLLKMSEYLTSHSRLEEKEIKQFMIDFSAEEWVRTEGFITKSDYFSYKAMISAQLEDVDRITLKKAE